MRYLILATLLVLATACGRQNDGPPLIAVPLIYACYCQASCADGPEHCVYLDGIQGDAGTGRYYLPFCHNVGRGDECL
jgi:hypothetical protein